MFDMTLLAATNPGVYAFDGSPTWGVFVLFVVAIFAAVFSFFAVLYNADEGNWGWVAASSIILIVAVVGVVCAISVRTDQARDEATALAEFRVSVSDWLEDEHGVLVGDADLESLTAGKRVVVTVNGAESRINLDVAKNGDLVVEGLGTADSDSQAPSHP